MTDNQTPPAGYSKLPDGTRCRCVKLWQSDDGFYCCKPRVPAMTDRTNYCTGCKERQDRIEALTAENERLRALLYPDEMTQEDYEAIYGWGGQG